MSIMANTATSWNDRFSRPGESDLLSGLNRDDRRLIERVITKCEGIGANARCVLWQGIPWRWTIQLSLGNGKTLLFVIPEPGRPQLAVPLDAADLDRLPMRRLSKSIRDGILNARTVESTLWPEWELTSNTQVDELMTLIRVRVQGLDSDL